MRPAATTCGCSGSPPPASSSGRTTASWSPIGSLSSTTDYGLAVDAAGNALLAFNDDSQAAERIVAAKISPDGQALWGTPGIAVSTSSGFLASPRIAGTDDGDAVVAWVEDADTVLQRLDPAGAKLWVAGRPRAGAHRRQLRRSPISRRPVRTAVSTPATSSSPGCVTCTFAGAKHLWAQKLDPDGAPLWGAGHKQVFDLAGGSLQFGNFPGFEPDGAGGAVFAWYTSTPSLQVRVQRLLAAGTEAFAHDGVEVSTDGSRLRVDPSAAFDRTRRSSPFSGWRRTRCRASTGSTASGSTPLGTRLWGSTGIAFVALGATEITQVRALTALTGDARAARRRARTSGAMRSSPGPRPSPSTISRSARRASTPTGSLVWAAPISTLKTSATSTSRLAARTSSDGFAAFAWTDGESARDLKAQNLNLDGTLGAWPFFADGFETGGTAAWSATVP